MSAQTLPPEQFQVLAAMNNQHPSTWTKGNWYPATLPNGKPCDIQRTRSAGKPYLKIRREITVNTKTRDGEIIDSRKSWEYWTVNLTGGTVTYLGW